MFCFHLTAPFPGTAAHYTISSRQEEKVIETAVEIFSKYVLIDLVWSGQTGKRLAQFRDVQTKRSEVRAP